MTATNICILISIIAYLILVLGIGVAFMKKNETADDFYLGGRKLGPFVTAMSAEASDMSSYLLMGLPGLAYATGLADVTWTAIGLAAGTYLNWLLVAKKLRRYSVEAGNAVTVPAFFVNRYRDRKKITGIIAALVIIIFFVPYTASGFAACGKLFSTLFGVDYFTAMIISAVVIVTYTTMGGFLAASTSDFIQSIVMTFAIIIVVGYGTIKAGGPESVIDNAQSLAGYFTMSATHVAETNEAAPYGFLTIISTLAWGLGYFGMPHILLRFMASKDSKQLTLSRRIASVWVVISMGVAIAIGIVGNAMTKKGVIPAVEDPEKILIYIAQLIASHGVAAALVAGVILAGILAATMSTADSQLLAASSSASQDILKNVFWKDMSDTAGIVVARVTVLVISLIGVFIAKNPDSSVFSIVSFAWAGFGAAFGPAMLFSLFWKRTNLPGIVAGMVSGGVMIFIWKFLVRPVGGIWNIYELLPAFIVSALCILVVSLLTGEPDREIVEEFERVKVMTDGLS
ncbi:MAG: sodium/proline symporter [Lachnospiraceae bacterium]|jgi:sodium/proline symporter|nr:sodium/proline symporter [Lachnospiraceae bacterium]